MIMRFKDMASPEFPVPDNEANKIMPVSYTHLRAHETVLDLVCRLLLEKKTEKHSHIRLLLYSFIPLYSKRIRLQHASIYL